MNKKILITGGAGFGGSGLAHALVKKGGYDVTVLDVVGPLHAEKLKDIMDQIRYKWMSVQDTKPEDVAGQDIIIHLAAAADVPLGHTAPLWNNYENIVGSQMLCEACKGAKQLKKLIYAGCHDSQTRVVTRDGIKSVTEINKDTDEVLSLNPETKQVEYKRIAEVLTYPWDGELLHFKGKRFDLMVTPNHSMWLEDRPAERADKTATRAATVHLPGAHPDFELDGMPLMKGISTEDYFYLVGLYLSDGSSYQHKRDWPWSGKEGSGAGERDDSTGRFIQGETRDKTKIYTSPKTFFHVPKGDKAHKRLIETLNRCNIKHSVYEMKVYTSSHLLYEMFDECGHEAHVKRVPKWMLEGKPRYLKALLQGLLDGDGCRNRAYTTVSTDLARDVAEIVFKVGLQPTISWREGKDVTFPDGHNIIGKGNWEVYISKTRPGVIGKQASKVPYNGDVWCLKVPDNHNFLVERNGRFAFSGNSGNEFGRPVYLPIDEKHPLTPHNPYSFSKAAAELCFWTYMRCYDLPVVVMSNGAVCGKGMRREIFIYKWLWNIAHNRPCVLEGGDQTRDLTHVDDVLKAWMAVIEAPEENVIGEKFQVSYGEEISVSALLDTCFEVTGKPVNIIHKPHRPGEIGQREFFTNEKARWVLGYNPVINYREAILRTWNEETF